MKMKLAGLIVTLAIAGATSTAGAEPMESALYAARVDFLAAASGNIVGLGVGIAGSYTPDGFHAEVEASYLLWAGSLGMRIGPRFRIADWRTQPDSGWFVDALLLARASYFKNFDNCPGDYCYLRENLSVFGETGLEFTHNDSWAVRVLISAGSVVRDFGEDESDGASVSFALGVAKTFH